MILELYIRDLLFKYECVTVPGFGAFLTRSYGFEVNTISGEFIPSRKEITFNSLLTSNDGVLANYFAKKQKISYESAIRLIEKEAGVWRKKLNTQAIHLDSLGKLILNQDKRIEFNPYGKLNFDSSVFGLSSFSKKPFLSSKKIVFIPQSKKVIAHNSFYRYAAVGLITLVLSTTSLYFGDQYVSNQKLLNQEVAQDVIINNIQSATFDLGKLNSVSLSVSVVKKKIVPEIKNPRYSIIAGTFRNKKYAKRKIEKLKREGYKAALAEINPKGMFRVAYGRFESKSEAIKLLYFLKYTLKKDAWYLIEK